MNIFLQPAGESSEEQLKITINKKENLETLKEYITSKQYEELSKLYQDKQLNMWGVTLKKEDTWKQMQNGDMVLFYGCKKFFVKGIIQYKLHNRKLAKNIWGEDKTGLTWEYIYFLDNAQPINIPLEEFNNVTGYKLKHVQGAMKVGSQDIVEKILEEYKDIFSINYNEIKQKEENTRIQKLENKIWQLNIENVNINCKITTHNSQKRRTNNLTINENKKTRKNQRKKNLNESISNAAKYHLGILGEQYIYKLLEEKNESLLKQLNLLNRDIEIQCYNKDYNGQTDWIDKSINKGHDILVKADDKEIYLEVKTSIEDTNFYTMTGNEVRFSKIKGKDYYIVKVSNLGDINNANNNTKVSIIRNPYKLIEEVESVREISMYY